MDVNKLKEQLQIEVDTAFLYDSIAAIQSDENLSRVLQSLSEIEKGHAKHMLDKVHTFDSSFTMPQPSSRAKFQLRLGKVFGYSSIISNLSSIEKQFAVHAVKNKLKHGELVPTSTLETVLTDIDTNVARNWHTTKPLAFDDKDHMYVPYGSPNDACQDMALYGPTGTPHGKGLDPCPDLEKHGGIWRFDAKKTNLTINDGYRFATGLRSVALQAVAQKRRQHLLL